MYTYTYIHIHESLCIYVKIVYIYEMCVYMCEMCVTYVYMYVHTHTHTHTHTHISLHSPLQHYTSPRKILLISEESSGRVFTLNSLIRITFV